MSTHITEVIPTRHNTLHVESVSVARGRLSKLIDELESGTWLSFSLLVGSDLSDSELPESHNFRADRKNFAGAYPPVPPSFHILCPLLLPSSKFQHTVHYTKYSYHFYAYSKQ